MAAESSISANSGRVVFLDRDGVMNRRAAPHDYIKTWEEFHFLPGVAEAIRQLNEAHYTVLVVTNQRGVARGIMTMDAVNHLHQEMCGALENQGAHISGVFVCPHEKGTCRCHKPEIGLLLQAERDFPVDKAHSWLVGDSENDILAGIRYGVTTILIGAGDFAQDFRAKGLPEAVNIILGGYEG